jgi:hypothetical protein
MQPLPSTQEDILALLEERNHYRREHDILKVEKAMLLKENDAARRFQFVPPGHFYSPIPDLDEISKRSPGLFTVKRNTVPGVRLQEDSQLALLQAFAKYYRELNFPEGQTPGRRYFYQNPAYGYSDAICLYSMLRHVKPRQVIEIGSGYSSCVTLDTNEDFFQNRIQCTFIEPHPELLESLITPADRERVRILPCPLQEVPLETFQTLQANDILFVDSTHVSKIGSDVNYIFFQLLPALAAGVYVHFHDIFFPFEYPQCWVLEGRAWNEDYLLKAFLQYNDTFEIVFFNTFLEMFHPEKFEQLMPLCLQNPGGSIWIKKMN